MSSLVKAIRIEQHGGPEVLKLVEVEVPPPADNEVTIRQHVAGLNFIDIYYRTGLYKGALPHGLGFEGAGEVVAVGKAVTRLKKGDRVAYGQSPLGGYAQMRNVPAAQVVKLPKGIAFDEAAAMMLKGLTVQYLFRQTYRLQGGETILFHAAAGGVGLIACQWAKALGVKHQAVYAWFRAGGVPLERAIQIEALTKVPRTKLIKPSLARALQVADQLDVL